MTTKNQIEKFFSSKTLAIVGVSSTKRKFGYTIFKELIKHGFNVIPINPKASSIDEFKCYDNLFSVKEKIDAVITVVQPKNVLQIVKDAFNLGIKNIWMQQGSASNEALQFCKENNINVIHNECILMFTENLKFPHSFHKWINKIFKKLPE